MRSIDELPRRPEGYIQELTLRDYFAAKIAASIFAGDAAQMVANRDGRYNEENWGEVVALNAYEMADIMLKVRAK